jgi:hypothetical protein
MAEAAKKKTGAKDPMEAIAKLNRSVQAKQRVKEEAAANDPVQLPMWDDDLRGVPNCLARGALFTAIKSDGSKREFYRGKEIATLAGIDVSYRGEELRQDDYSVFLNILHFARHYDLGRPIPFTAYQMLKELGWSINTDEYGHLRECCERLLATSITVALPKMGGSQGFSGSLIQSFAWKDDGGKQLSRWQVMLEPRIAALFIDPLLSLMNPAERKAIGGRSPLAQWLHSFLCTHQKPFAISVEKYYELSGSRTANMADFRARLKLAFLKLVNVGFLESFDFRNDVVHVVRVARRYPAPVFHRLPHNVEQASLQL